MKKEKLVLRASAASVWANCPGSTKIKSGKYPYDDNAAAVFGNAVHNTASAILKKENVSLTIQEELQKNERPVDFENYLRFYLDAIKNYGWSEGIRIIEEYRKFEFDSYVIAGTMDYAVLQVLPDKIKLQIIDLKTGFVPVDVNDNLQLYVYAHLIILHYLAGKKTKKQIEIESIIVQPAHNILKFSTIQFSPERFKVLYDINSRKLKTGSHCKYCHKADICSELKKCLQEYYKPEIQGVTVDRAELIAEILPMAQTVEKITSRIQADAKKLILDGGKIPGWKIGQKGGHRSWVSTIGIKEILQIVKKKFKTVKKSDLTEEKIMSPAQIEKNFKGVDLSPLTFKPYNDILIPDEDDFEAREF